MQRHSSACLMVLAALLATLSRWAVGESLRYLPPRAAFIVEAAVTGAVVLLWYRWQRDAWGATLPRASESQRVVLMVAICCLAISAAYHAWIPAKAQPLWPLDTTSTWGRATVVLLGALTVPLIEEAIFRGFMLGNLLKHHGPTTSVILSGVTFGVARADPTRIVPQIAAGILLGAIVVRTKRLWLAVATHGALNLSGFVEGFAFHRGVPERLGILFPVLCVITAIIAALELRRVLTTTRWYIPPSPASLVAPPVTWGLKILS